MSSTVSYQARSGRPYPEPLGRSDYRVQTVWRRFNGLVGMTKRPPRVTADVPSLPFPGNLTLSPHIETRLGLNCDLRCPRGTPVREVGPDLARRPTLCHIGTARSATIRRQQPPIQSAGDAQVHQLAQRARGQVREHSGHTAIRRGWGWSRNTAYLVGGIGAEPFTGLVNRFGG